MPATAGRRSAVLVIPLAVVLLAGIAGPGADAATAPPGLKRFMHAVAMVESSGRYTARNPDSGAYGKYQIMPASWRGWARQYLGDARAPQTPANQERVARAKMTSLFRWLGTWRRVAYWWLTGSSRTTGWSPFAKAYVTRVMQAYGNGPGRGSASPATPATPAVKRFTEASRTIDYGGHWSTAAHAGYAGGRVRYTTQRGATATFTFVGRGILWYGPVGPTRGQARVSVDGRLVRTVDLRRAGFDPRALVFSTRWASSGRHTLTIEVVGTRGHPMVAIDELVIRR